MNENHAVVEVQMDEPMTAMQPEKISQEDMVWKDPVAAQEVVENEPLACLKAEEINELKSRWSSIQIEFVDDPNLSVKQADDLVVEALERFEQALQNQRSVLVEKWNNQENVSTEDLRIALQSYRSFLDRLLTIGFTSS
jgi:K+-sensing histidine kinase KdpD